MNTHTEDGRLNTSHPKVAAILALTPQLMFQKAQLRQAGFDPVAVVLPADMDPGKYTGEGATDVGAQFLGMPIIWGDRVGLVLPA